MICFQFPEIIVGGVVGLVVGFIVGVVIVQVLDGFMYKQ